MTKKRGITAAELMSQLQNDAQFQEREAQREARRHDRKQLHLRLFAPLLAELRTLGYEGESLETMLPAYCPLPDDFVTTLLAFLPKESEARVCEQVVRALGAATNPFDGRPLVQCFESTNDESLKWAIVNTIALTRPRSIDNWLASLCNSSAHWKVVFEKLGYPVVRIQGD